VEHAVSRKTLVSWSSGKDCAWALHVLSQDPCIEVVGLFSTVNRVFDRVAMHGVRVDLLKGQAESVGMPLRIIWIPHPCDNDQYEAAMNGFIDEARAEGIECMAFGDLFLADVRRYRESRLSGTGITPLFPLWGAGTGELARRMVSQGVRARVTCVDSRFLPGDFVGREYDSSFLEEIPQTVDPCGERGEFHTFVFDGPMFLRPVEISVGERVERDGFVFADIVSKSP